MTQTTDQSRGKSSGPSFSRKPRTGASVARPGVPSPPRRRRPALTALAVLLIVGGAALAGWLALRLDSRTPVLVVAQKVDVGQKITGGMLKSVNVSGVQGAIPLDQADQFVGKFYARQTIYPGQLLQTNLMRKLPPLGADQAQVGVPLTSGKFPTGLRTGDEVRLLRIGDAQTQPKALCSGLVIDVTTPKSGGFGADAKAPVATIVIPQNVSDQVVGATGSDQLGAALIGRGIGVDDATIESYTGGGN